MITIDEIRKKENKEIHSIELPPLTMSHTAELVSETLKTSQANARELSDIVFQKTGGNPFFMKEFLKTLRREKLLWWDE